MTLLIRFEGYVCRKVVAHKTSMSEVKLDERLEESVKLGDEEYVFYGKYAESSIIRN